MQVSAYKAFVTIFYALDAAYYNNSSNDLGQFLSAANPFLFKGEGSADSAVYEGFRVGYPGDAEEAEAMSFVRDYLKKQGEFLLIAFDSVADIDAWKEALK